MSRRERIKDLYALTADDEKLAMANPCDPVAARPRAGSRRARSLDGACA